jgi:hypothetical protein
MCKAATNGRGFTENNTASFTCISYTPYHFFNHDKSKERKHEKE